METQEWKWKSFDSLEMYARAWLPAGEAKAAVCLVHGLGEHVGRYATLAAALTGAGYLVTGFDQRGFGQSGGKRGHTPSLEAYFTDIDTFLTEVARRYPQQPRFLYGYSMGGVLVLAYTPVRKPQLVGVIAASPGLKSSVEEQKVKVLLSKVLGKLIPTLTLTNGLDAQMVSRDPGIADNLKNDPLVHDKITAGWGKTMMEALAAAYQHASSFPLPLLLMHGTQDEIAYPRGSQAFADLAPKDKVTLKWWDGLLHELHSEPEKAEVFRYVIQWLDGRLS